MIVPVIDTATNEVKTVNVSDIFYVTRGGINGSVLKVTTEENDYQMLSNSELIRHLNVKGYFVKSDRATYVNPIKVKRLNNISMSAEFENGKQAPVSKLGFKAIDVLLNNSK
ncbi:LytTR family transcriptional regulator DNA-binding domain-containing protein [Paenibacillus barcinonensis]|uniref:LytTR family transcriptional regulator DNA-binding domain-containing protein n=1 Tax=Paenibacillus barcinonensis TaxID=198119 RepID=A0A2V4VDC5_PAEBA|nr:LytTR family transcriptional regulator DNA-binding domain-containing protein [Paenibacillus barcinonensis]PYE51582.1 LytTr DNA-binding domain-containing protein [Paenibacillus barcinonensis]QKS55950.1 LytTR family transcriptional regulator DNA-binding domain-containing protein [Paenibacillus barcinonensis]